MDGLEAVELKLSEVKEDNKNFRIDSTFYQRELVKLERGLQKMNHFYLNSSEVISGPFGSTLKSHSYKAQGVPFVRIENIKGGFEINKDDLIYISEEDNELLKNSQLFLDDLILSKVGNTIGYYARVDEEIERCNISENNLGLKLKNYQREHKHFILCYLNCKVGQKLTLRRVSGNAQPKLNVGDLTEIPIPIFSSVIYERISKIVIKSRSVSIKSKLVYENAKDCLLQELGLQNWQPTQANTEIKSVKNSFLQSGRLDAEYYQPKYDEVEFAIKNNSKYYKSIVQIATFNARGLQPVYHEEGDLNIINSMHILDKTLDYGNFEKTQSRYWDLQGRARVFRNDILTYTTGANIGRTHAYLSDEKALASNHVNILRIKNENPVYVAFAMNSILGRLQTEKLSAGSAQQELYPKDIDNFLIPFIEKEKQEQICENVLQSLHLKAHSQQLLQTAKQAVEIAIEESEEAAMAFIDRNSSS